MSRHSCDCVSNWLVLPVERLIKYSGYGNCAGLLASLGLLAGGGQQEDTRSDSEDSDTEEYEKIKHM